MPICSEFRFRRLWTLLLFVALAGAAEAQNLDIECPANLDIRSSLQGSPWTGPDGSAPVSATNIHRSDGKTELVCDYGQAGTARIPMPRGYTTCFPRDTGFNCTHEDASGRDLDRVVDLRLGDGLNLDNGRLNTRRRDDLVFTGRNGPYLMLQPVNGTRFSRPLREFRSPRACRGLRHESRDLVLGRDIVNGTVLCYRTGRGRHGIFLVENQSRDHVRLALRTSDGDGPTGGSGASQAEASRTIDYASAEMPAYSSLEFQFPGSSIVQVDLGNAGARLTAAGGRSEHYSTLSGLKAPAGPSKLTFDIRPENARKFRIQFHDSAPNGMLVDIDLANATFQLHERNVILEPDVSVEAVRGGWIRVAMSGLFPANDRAIIAQLLDVRQNTNFVPGGESILIRNLTLN